MIILEILFTLCTTGAAGIAAYNAGFFDESPRVKESRKRLAEIQQYAALPTPEPVVVNPAVELILELIKSDDENWTKVYNTGTYSRWRHASGVKLDISNGKAVEATLLGDVGDGETSVELSESNKGSIGVEIKALETRQRAAKQRELARVLAKRITDPSTRPVLGAGDVSGSNSKNVNDAADRRTVADAISAGLLVYNDKTGKIVRTSPGNSARLDETVAKRYGLMHVSRTLTDRRKREIEENLRLDYDDYSDPSTEKWLANIRKAQLRSEWYS